MELFGIDWQLVTPEEVQSLIDGLENIDVQVGDCKHTIFHCVALWNANPNVIDVLKNAKAKPNIPDKCGKTPLHLAAESNNRNSKIIEALLNAGAELNAEDKKKRTPLYLAIKNNTDYKVIEFLVDANADLKMGADEKGTLLHLALANYKKFKNMGIREYGVIRILLQKGVDYNTPNAEGKTPLALAIADKNQTAIQILKEAGASE